MAAARLTLEDLKALDSDALRSLILLQQEELSSRNTEIDSLLSVTIAGTVLFHVNIGPQ